MMHPGRELSGNGGARVLDEKLTAPEACERYIFNIASGDHADVVDMAKKKVADPHPTLPTAAGWSAGRSA